MLPHRPRLPGAPSQPGPRTLRQRQASKSPTWRQSALSQKVIGLQGEIIHRANKIASGSFFLPTYKRTRDGRDNTEINILRCSKKSPFKPNKARAYFRGTSSQRCVYLTHGSLMIGIPSGTQRKV